MRDSFPDALKGVITVEEAQDFPNQEIKDITPQPKDNPMDAVFGKEEPENVPEIELVSNDDAVADSKGPENAIVSQDVSKDVTEVKGEKTWEMLVEEGIKEYSTAKEWAVAMESVWKEIEADNDMFFSERRHVIGEHKKQQEETIKRLKKENSKIAIELGEKYSKILARLSVKSKEAKEQNDFIN